MTSWPCNQAQNGCNSSLLRVTQKEECVNIAAQFLISCCTEPLVSSPPQVCRNVQWRTAIQSDTLKTHSWLKQRSVSSERCWMGGDQFTPSVRSLSFRGRLLKLKCAVIIKSLMRFLCIACISKRQSPFQLSLILGISLFSCLT